MIVLYSGETFFLLINQLDKIDMIKFITTRPPYTPINMLSKEPTD